MDSNSIKADKGKNSPIPIISKLRINHGVLDLKVDDFTQVERSRSDFVGTSWINITVDGQDIQPSPYIELLPDSETHPRSPVQIDLDEIDEANINYVPINQDEMIQTELKCDVSIQAWDQPCEANVQTEITAIPKPKFDIKSTKLYHLYIRYYQQFDELSEAVYKDFDDYNILSPQDVYSVLQRVKIIVHRQKKGDNSNADNKFIIGYYTIAMKTLDYLMAICNLNEYYEKVKTHYNDHSIDNSIKSLIRVKKMYKIINALQEIFDFVRRKEEAQDDIQHQEIDQ